MTILQSYYFSCVKGEGVGEEKNQTMVGRSNLIG